MSDFESQDNASRLNLMKRITLINRQLDWLNRIKQTLEYQLTEIENKDPQPVTKEIKPTANSEITDYSLNH
jgi:hypothetical protein